jgi:hypothetical protein
MNKFLRYSFVALLAMVFGNVMAEDVTDTLHIYIKRLESHIKWC